MGRDATTKREPEGAATRGRLIPFGRRAGRLATRPVKGVYAYASGSCDPGTDSDALIRMVCLTSVRPICW
jgi:hypothetical protein